MPGSVQPVVYEHVRVFLSPAQAAQGAENREPEVILAPDLDLRDTQVPPGSALKAQQHRRVVVERPPRYEGAQLGAHALKFQARDIRRELFGVRPDVAQRSCRTTEGRIDAPLRLLVASLGLGGGEPALVVFHRHLAHLSEHARSHHLAGLPDQRIPAVVVRHGEQRAGALHRLDQNPRLIGIHHHRLVADHMQPGLNARERHREMQVVGRHDAHHLKTLLRWQRPFAL